ncbi:hypothetical protein AAMO2058_000510100 [Amorphochlora amoebiformis]
MMGFEFLPGSEDLRQEKGGGKRRWETIRIPFLTPSVWIPQNIYSKMGQMGQMEDNLLGDVEDWDLPERRAIQKEAGLTISHHRVFQSATRHIEQLLEGRECDASLVLVHAGVLAIIILTSAFFLHHHPSSVLLLYYVVYAPVSPSLNPKLTNGFEVALAAYVWSSLWTITAIFDISTGSIMWDTNNLLCAFTILILLILQTLIFIFGRRTYGEAQWRLFYVAGCSIEIKNLFYLWEKFNTLLKIDLYINICIILQLMFLAVRDHNISMGLISGGLVLIHPPIAYYAFTGIKQEVPWRVYVFYTLASLELCSVLYSVLSITMYDTIERHCTDGEDGMCDSLVTNNFTGYQGVDLSLYCVAMFCIRASHVFCAAMLHINFGKGLKQVNDHLVPDIIHTLKLLVCAWDEIDRTSKAVVELEFFQHDLKSTRNVRNRLASEPSPVVVSASRIDGEASPGATSVQFEQAFLPLSPRLGASELISPRQNT